MNVLLLLAVVLFALENCESVGVVDIIILQYIQEEGLQLGPALVCGSVLVVPRCSTLFLLALRAVSKTGYQQIGM
jgi:hypothetical protein